MKLAIWFDTETPGYDLGEPACVLEIEEPEDAAPVLLRSEDVADLLQAWRCEDESAHGWTAVELFEGAEFILAVAGANGIYFESWTPTQNDLNAYDLSGFPFAIEAKAV